MQYFRRKLDDKNRLTIPVELRADFEGGAVLTPGFDNYLHIYPKAVWENDMQAALSGSWKSSDALPAIIDRDLADLTDQLTDGMVETQLDSKQGRITLDQDLLDYAKVASAGEIVATKMPGGYWRIKRPRR
jgi:DNA-binding transcriptional regulator/RsmH inhibitor MraZ